MAELSRLFVTIGSKFDAKGFNKAQTRLDKLKVAMKTLAVVGAAVGAAAVAGIIKLTGVASDLEETTAKFNTVFKNQIGLAEEWSRKLVESYGVSTEESKRFLGSIQDLLVPMGLQSDVAAKLSNEVVKLSVDLGSFNNMPTEKVMLDIQSALVGNFETMKKYGVVLNATKIEQHIMNQNLVESKKDITQAMKAQAAYELIVKGSEAALGDFNRTSDGYANQVKIMTAKMDDLAAKLGTIFIPIMKDIVSIITKDILPIFEDWIENMGGVSVLSEKVGRALQFVIKVGSGLIKTIGVIITTGKELLNIFSALLDGVAGIDLAFRGKFGAAGEAFKSMKDKIKDSMGEIGDTFADFSSDVSEFLATDVQKTVSAENKKVVVKKNALATVLNATKNTASEIAGIETELANQVTELQQTVQDGTAATFEGILTGAETLEEAVPNIFGNIKNAIIRSFSEIAASAAVQFVLGIFTGGASTAVTAAIGAAGAFGGLERGGLVKTPGIFQFAERSKPEIALPLTSPETTDALADALSKAGSSGQPGMQKVTNIINVPPIPNRATAKLMAGVIKDELFRPVKMNRKI